MKTLIVSLTDTDHLRLIGHVSAEEERAMREALAMWPHGIKKEEYRDEIPFKVLVLNIYI